MGTTRRKYAKRLPPEQRRDQLLDAALHRIGAGGFSSLTMEAVAKQAGVTKPVLYEMYGNRSELLTALLEREAARALAQVVAALPTGFADRTPDDTFADTVRVFIEAIVECPDRWRLVLLPPDGTPREFRDQVAVVRSGILEQVKGLAELGIKARGGPSGLDAELLGHTMLALAEMVGRLVLTDPARFTPQRLTDFISTVAYLLPKDAQVSVPPRVGREIRR